MVRLGQVVVGASLFHCCLLVGCRSSTVPSQQRPSVPVAVAPVVRGSAPVWLTAIGNVEAYATIAVKAQVGGELVRVFFEEGRDVRTGDALFQIDPRPYQLAAEQAEAALAKDLAQLQQAQANLARDRAQSRNADAQAERFGRLFAEGVISRDQSDQFRTNADTLRESIHAGKAAIQSAEAAVAADRVAIRKAKLDLEYCLIRSPIDGRTGVLMANAGNLIKANADTALITIHQTRPIFVTFSVPEENLAAVRQRQKIRPLQVEARVSDRANQAVNGRLTFIDNNVDTSSGGIRLKATFSNETGALWPGEFVDIRMLLEEQSEVTLVPSEAVQSGAQGHYVYVVKADQTVESRTVTVGHAVERQVVVESGVAAGETVVTDGHLRLAPGARVRIVPAVAGGS